MNRNKKLNHPLLPAHPLTVARVCRTRWCYYSPNIRGRRRKTRSFVTTEYRRRRQHCVDDVVSVDCRTAGNVAVRRLGRGGGGGRGGFHETLERDRRAPVLQALVRGQAVLGPVPPPAELAHVRRRARPAVLVQEVPFQRVVAAERPPAVRTVLWLVDAAVGRRW